MVYYKKRFITIYPLFLVSCFSLFFITRMGMGNYIVDLKQLGLTLVGMACFISVPPKTVWFISMLIPLYIVTPLYNKLSMKLKIIVIFACYTTIVMKPGRAYSDVRVFYLLPIYFIGLMLGEIFFVKKYEWTKRKNTLLLMTSSIVAVVSENLSLGIGNEFKIEKIIVKSIYMLFFILFLFTLSYEVEVRIKNNKWVSILENISVASLTCYLFHRQIYFVLNILFGEYNSFFECITFFLLVLIISICIQKYYGKVIMLHKKRKQ